MKLLKGVITAMTTPFDENDNIDSEAIKEQTEFLISKGVDALYPCGTTGEMLLMSVEERKTVAETVVKQARGRVTVYIHVGAMTQKNTVELAKHAYEIGADGIGVVTPVFFHMTDEELINYYSTIAHSVPETFPIYLYAIPQLAKNDITAELAQKLAAANKNIVGIKYSYPDTERIQDLLRVNEGKFSVVMGPDRLFLPGLLMGCSGTVSGCSGPMPEFFVEIYKAYLAGNMERAAQIQRDAIPAIKALRGGSRLEIFKETLNMRGLKGGHVRAPLLDLSDEERPAIQQEIYTHLEKIKEILN